jgi:hypothetical protein
MHPELATSDELTTRLEERVFSASLLISLNLLLNLFSFSSMIPMSHIFGAHLRILMFSGTRACNRIDREQRRKQSILVEDELQCTEIHGLSGSGNVYFKYTCEILRLYSQFLRLGNTTLIQNTFKSPTADETINTSKPGD